MKSEYTKKTHEKVVEAIKKNERLFIKLHDNSFITSIKNSRKGIIFKVESFYTIAMTHENFLQYNYLQFIDELKEVHKRRMKHKNDWKKYHYNKKEYNTWLKLTMTHQTTQTQITP
jgi:hypothetical protein